MICSKKTAGNKPEQQNYLTQTSLIPKYNVEYKEMFRIYPRIRRNEKPRTAF
jgi:hypothetical protein